jgi:hypothetical protein
VVRDRQNADEGSVSERESEQTSLQERLREPDAVLSRTDLRELGFGRRAIDAIFRACPVAAVPGYSRPLIYVRDYLDVMERNTFRDDRVRP